MFIIIKSKRENRSLKAKKWLKTPHNRFKMLSKSNDEQEKKEEEFFDNKSQFLINNQNRVNTINQNRSHQNQFHTTTTTTKKPLVFPTKRKISPEQEKVISLGNKMFKITILLVLFIQVAEAATQQNQASQQQNQASISTVLLRQHNNKSPNSNTSAIKTPQWEMESGRNGSAGKPTRLEEEVSLIVGDTSSSTNNNNNSSSSRLSSKDFKRHQRANQRPQVIRIQASLNGKLMAPARVDSLAGGNGSANVKESAFEADEGLVSEPWLRTTASTINADQPTTTSSAPETTESCQQPVVNTEPEVQHASISTSSQMLRLTTNKGAQNRTLIQQLLSNSPSETSSNLDDDDSSSMSSSKPVEIISQQQQGFGGSQQQLLSSTAAIKSAFQQPAISRSGISASDHSQLGATINNQQQQQQPESQRQVVASGESILSLIDDYDSKITTNRTKAQLSCDSGEMVLRLNFSDSFKGIVYPDHNRLSPCRFFGDGHHNYELRLPLRGCGTRQAAPRVFVNDVIVRFHKTLELEEDEVKTLICRYPPPLAPETTLPESPTLNPSIIGHRQPTTTTTTTNGDNTNSVIEQESPAQFEFVDSLSGRPKSPELNQQGAGNSGNIETMSENLIVAPAGGQQLNDPFNGGLTQTRPNLRYREPTIDSLNSRNSLLLDNNNRLLQQQTGGSSAGSSSLLERFSSIELLFIISSLMFLVLLTIGLATSYYCFRRHAHRGSMQRASAILKRKRRYVGPGALIQSADHSGNPTASIRPPNQAALQQYYSQRMANQHQIHHHQHHHQRRPSLTAPSSPESDLSNRGLLAPNTQHMASYRSSHHYPSYNQAFVPDTAGIVLNNGSKHHYAATPYLTPAPTTYSVGEGGGGAAAAGLAGRRQRSMHQIPVTGPVLGRRGTIYDRPQRYLSPSGHSRGNSRPSQFSPFSQSKGNLTLIEQQQQPAMIPPNYGQMTLNRNVLDSLSQQQQQHQIVDFDIGPTANNLSRAKSLSSVRYLEPLVGGPQQLPADQFLGGTEARGRRRRQRMPDGQEFVNNNNGGRRSAMRRANGSSSFSATKEYSSDSEVEPNNNNISHNQTQTQKPSILLKSIEDSYITNLTEIYEQEYIKQDSTRPFSMSQWRAAQPQKASKKPQQQQQKSNNNGSQEDSLKRSREDPGSGINPEQVDRDDNEEEDDGDDSDDNETVKERRLDVDGDDDEDDDEQRYHSTNLRSLTELDVNFAKSLLLPSIGNLKTTSSADQLTNKTSKEPTTSTSTAIGNDERETSQPKSSQIDETKMMRSSSAPKEMDMDHQHQQVKEKILPTPQPTSEWKRDVDNTTQSPDLILSPEYDHDNRLELKPQNTSHNSVSYV